MDETYERPILSRYVDPVELIWLATAKRLGLTIRRSPTIFSATDGSGLLQLGARETLDEDDTLSQMVLHEICHWITNGLDTFTDRDWGFDLDGPLDPREHAGLRLQAWATGRHGLRALLAPTSAFRDYYNRIPEDPFEPMDDSDWERDVVVLTRDAVQRAMGAPWTDPLEQALEATRQIGCFVNPFLTDYATEISGDTLPSLWKTLE